MKTIVELSECINDSPKFRSVLCQHEEELENLESRLEKVVKACGAMTVGGRKYIELQVINLMRFDTFSDSNEISLFCSAATVSHQFVGNEHPVQHG